MEMIIVDFFLHALMLFTLLVHETILAIILKLAQQKRYLEKSNIFILDLKTELNSNSIVMKKFSNFDWSKKKNHFGFYPFHHIVKNSLCLLYCIARMLGLDFMNIEC